MKYADVKNGVVVAVSSRQLDGFVPVPDNMIPGVGLSPTATDAELAAAQVTIRRTSLINAIDAKTRSGISLGYTRNGKRFSASDNHQTWALGILVGIQAGVDHTGIDVPTIDNTSSHTIVDNADAAAQAMACITYVKTWLASGSILKKQAMEDNVDFDAIEATNNARS